MAVWSCPLCEVESNNLHRVVAAGWAVVEMARKHLREKHPEYMAGTKAQREAIITDFTEGTFSW